MDSLYQRDCLSSQQASTHCTRGWGISLACTCSPHNGPEGDEIFGKAGVVCIPAWCDTKRCWRMHPLQSAVVVPARGSHRGNASTALEVSRSLFGLPCQCSTEKIREKVLYIKFLR